MFKWILLGLGGFLLWGGVDNYLNHSDHINETPVSLNASSLQQLLKGNKKTFISYNGAFAENGRVFKSYLEKPKYSAYAPNDAQQISLSSLLNNSEEQAEYLGARVILPARLEPRSIELQYIKKHGGERSMQGNYVIAPVFGSGGNLWVLSPFFASSDKSDRASWFQQTSYSGRLTRFADVSSNFKSLKKSFSEIQSIYAGESGQMIPSHALLIMCNRPKMLESDVPRMKYYGLVEGTNNSLFVEMNQAQDNEISENEVIKGILKPLESKYYQGFSRVLGVPKLPNKIGVISLENALAENEENNRVTMIGILGGLCMILLGLFLFRRS